jgi:phage-related holin
MLKYISFLFYTIEVDSFWRKIEASLWLGLLFSPVAYFLTLINKYILTDVSFLEILVLLLITDFVLGVVKHIKLHTFDFKEMYVKFLVKMLVSIAGMVIANMFGIFLANYKNPEAVNYIASTCQLMNFFYVGGSAVGSIFILSNKKFPPSMVMKRIKKYNETGKVTSFTEEIKIKN